ncbi:MAG: polyphosphate kinase 2 family protein [Gammaproteobacteria bacterium]
MSNKLKAENLADALRVKPGKSVSLREKDAARDFGWQEAEAEQVLKANRKRLEELQYKLYADGHFALLIVLQAIDGGGKDGTTRNVMTAFNPQGCTVTSFKAPSPEELRHDYLWRIHKHMPPRGEVAVFNRSHYEDVLVVRVDNLAPKAVWKPRFEQINNFERTLTESNVHVLKFFLQISKDEQRKRFEERLAEPAKQWKFSPADLDKRKQWNQYAAAFEDVLTRCSTKWAPWYLIPGDKKWFRNLAVSQIVADELARMPLSFPKLGYDPSKIRVR